MNHRSDEEKRIIYAASLAVAAVIGVLIAGKFYGVAATLLCTCVFLAVLNK